MRNKGYVGCQIGDSFVMLHNFIFGETDKHVVDHKNRDRFDNRKSNLRSATFSENAINATVRRDSSTGHKNVYMDHGRFRVSIMKDGVSYPGGVYTDKRAAVRAANALRQKYHGEFSQYDPYGDEPEV